MRRRKEIYHECYMNLVYNIVNTNRMNYEMRRMITLLKRACIIAFVCIVLIVFKNQFDDKESTILVTHPQTIRASNQITARPQPIRASDKIVTHPQTIRASDQITAHPKPIRASDKIVTHPQTIRASDEIAAHPQAVRSSETRSHTPQLVRKFCPSNQSYIDFGVTLTPEQLERVEKCVINFKADKVSGLQQDAANTNIRYTSHGYLNNNSFIIEAGGHLGLDVSQLNSRYHPGIYVVLEPVVEFFEKLKEKFKDSPNIVVYNFGVDVKNGNFLADSGNDGTSLFQSQNGSVELQIIAVSTFFEKLKIAEKKVDLVTLNCEGCEFAFLDYLLSTNYIHHFRNIQFQAHQEPEVCYPVKRFCWYQELLPKTHKLVFQHKFIWDSWTAL